MTVFNKVLLPKVSPTPSLNAKGLIPPPLHPLIHGCPRKVNTYVHPEAPTSILVQPLWHPPILPQVTQRRSTVQRATNQERKPRGQQGGLWRSLQGSVGRAESGEDWQWEPAVSEPNAQW